MPNLYYGVRALHNVRWWEHFTWAHRELRRLKHHSRLLLCAVLSGLQLDRFQILASRIAKRKYGATNVKYGRRRVYHRRGDRLVIFSQFCRSTHKWSAKNWLQCQLAGWWRFHFWPWAELVSGNKPVEHQYRWLQLTWTRALIPKSGINSLDESNSQRLVASTFKSTEQRQFWWITKWQWIKTPLQDRESVLSGGRGIVQTLIRATYQPGVI